MAMRAQSAKAGEAGVPAVIVETPTLAEAARRLYGPLVDRAIEEAAQFDSVDSEITLMRLWLLETLEEMPRVAVGDGGVTLEHTQKLMMRMFTQIVRAVAVKYRLSPKKATELSTAMETMLRYVHEEVLAPVAEEDL
jgi:hypothetical protein